MQQIEQALHAVHAENQAKTKVKEEAGKISLQILTYI